MTGDLAVVVETRSTGRRLVEETVMEDVVCTTGVSVLARVMVDEVDTAASGRTDTSTSAGLYPEASARSRYTPPVAGVKDAAPKSSVVNL